MASAVQFEQVLSDIIADERAAVLDELAEGAPEDYAAYRERVGYIRALGLFRSWCAEAGKKLDER